MTYKVWFEGGEFGIDTLEGIFETEEAAKAFITSEVDGTDGILTTEEFSIEYTIED